MNDDLQDRAIKFAVRIIKFCNDSAIKKRMKLESFSQTSMKACRKWGSRSKCLKLCIKYAGGDWRQPKNATIYNGVNYISSLRDFNGVLIHFLETCCP